MDKFVTITKKNNCDTNLAQFYGNQETVKKIQEIIFNNRIVCLYGNSGTGKTFLVNDILLKNQNVFEINGENIKSKAHTVELLARLKFSSAHLIIDDVDTDTYGFREISDRISNNEKLSHGSIIIISRVPLSITNCENIELLALSVNDMVAFGKNRYPYMNLLELVELAKKARGNIRNFTMSLVFSHDKDTFKTPKNMVYDMTCKNSKYPENPSAYIGKTIYEHEKQFWINKIEDSSYELYYEDIDTTFCLINKNHDSNCTIRIAGNFTAKHLPWYKENKIYNI